ncbi:MAG: ABC transporter permease [Oscillospiraceae bacterium]|nr:ABC transporter permease [Oscillospiraceae bacterium]
MRTRGWQRVFSFTFIQHIKTKSFIIGTIIICLLVAALSVLTNVLPVVLSKDDDNPGGIGGGDSNAPSFSTVWLYDEPSILADEDKAMISEMLEGSVSASDKSFDQMCADLEQTNSGEAAVKITAITNADGILERYNIRTVYSPESTGAENLNAVLCELVNRRVMLNAGVLPENYASTKVGISSFAIEAGAEEWSIFQSAMNYFVPIVVSLVLFMLIFAYGQIVAQSIATEKTSRVMELLLTSVRPLAVVIGKVLAMGLVGFTQFILIGAVGAASFAISSPFGFTGKAMQIAADSQIQEALSQATSGMLTSDEQIAQAVNEFSSAFSPLNIILIVIIFLLGFIFFALIAALIGASISRMEDLQQAMGPYSILGVVGMYLAYFPVIFNIDSMDTGIASTNPVQMFSYFFPISSPFALPSAILLGTLTPLQSLIGVAILAAAVVLVAVIVSKVYEAIILHNGNRIKFGDILKMAARK